MKFNVIVERDGAPAILGIAEQPEAENILKTFQDKRPLRFVLDTGSGPLETFGVRFEAVEGIRVQELLEDAPEAPAEPERE